MPDGALPLHPETVAASAGGAPDPVTGAVVPPIHPTTTFARDERYELIGDHIYSRTGSPTVDRLEGVLAELDDGATSLAFASGMAAITAVTATIPAGSRVVAPQIMYHGTRTHLEHLAARRPIELRLVPSSDTAGLIAAIEPGRTAAVWIETSLNPIWTVLDVAAIAGAAHAAGAKLIVDATVTPPCTTRVLDLGADVAVHSATKYLNGHSDLTAGVATFASTVDAGAVRAVRDRTGGVLGAFEAWLLLRGLRTLWMRFAKASESAAAIAAACAADARVEGVLYPGLPDHPTHEVAAAQMTGGFGGMLSLLLPDEAAARHLAVSTWVFVPATSLGGVESTIEHRAGVEGPGSPVPRNLVRLSVGVEHVDDLLADLDRALRGP